MLHSIATGNLEFPVSLTWEVSDEYDVVHEFKSVLNAFVCFYVLCGKAVKQTCGNVDGSDVIPSADFQIPRYIKCSSSSCMNSMFNFSCRHTGHSPLTREFPVLHIEPVTASLIACCSVSLCFV